jgi:hypothetical protein
MPAGTLLLWDGTVATFPKGIALYIVSSQICVGPVRTALSGRFASRRKCVRLPTGLLYATSEGAIIGAGLQCTPLSITSYHTTVTGA